jgi:hypothetical protein
MSIKAYADVLIATIQNLFPKATSAVQGKVFLVSVRVDIDDHDAVKELPTSRGVIHLAIIAETNYVKVMAAQTERTTAWRDITDWAVVCRHDSAWRDDGIRSTLISMHQKLLATAAETFKKPAKDLSVHLSIDAMGILPQVEVFGESPVFGSESVLGR